MSILQPTLVVLPLLALVLLLGGARTLPAGNYSNDTTPPPIEKRRICAELCSARLGGDACKCPAKQTPLETVLQQSDVAVHGTRRDACPVLCRNNLGQPLCKCERSEKSEEEPDFQEICTHFCNNYNHQIKGCLKCELYKNATVMVQQKSSKLTAVSEENINWDKWCEVMCVSGDGGAACNCDLLPMSAHI